MAAVFGTACAWSLDFFMPRYAASADVAIIPRRASVALDARFQAVGPQGGQRQGGFSRQGHRAALVGLVHQADLAERVFDRLRGDLEEDASPARLLSAIDADLFVIGMATEASQSDLIRLTAYAPVPGLAKALADTWAEGFVDDVNALFADVPRQVVDTIAAERASVRERYLEAESELQGFMAASRADLLDQEIAAKDAVIEEVVSTWHQTATAAFQKEVTSRLAAVDENLEQLRRTRANLADARALRSLLESANPSSIASNSLAIHLFKARMVSNVANLEIRLGEISAGSATDQQQDLDFTIKGLEEHADRLNQVIASQTAALASLVGDDASEQNGIRDRLQEMVRQLDTEGDQPMMSLLAKLEREKRALATAREQELTTKANLTVERDLLRTTLSTLQSEVVELELAVASAPSQVRLASGAVLPVDTAWPAAPLVGAISLVAGFLGALLLVPVASALGWQPPLGRRFAPVPA